MQVLGEAPNAAQLSDALPFGRLWYGRAEDAIGYAETPAAAAFWRIG